MTGVKQTYVGIFFFQSSGAKVVHIRMRMSWGVIGMAGGRMVGGVAEHLDPFQGTFYITDKSSVKAMEIDETYIPLELGRWIV